MIRRTALLVIGVISAVALPACGDDGGDARQETVLTTVANTTPPTPAPTTTAAPTTTTTTTLPPTTLAPTTEAPTTTLAPTTVETIAIVAPPQPVAPPPPRAEEAYVELGTIEIPAIGISKTLLEGISLNTLDRGPGHWPGTAMPGHAGNAVIAGHRTSRDKPFRYIDLLVPGDLVIFTTGDGTFTYTVTGTSFVKPDAIYIIDQTLNSTATLFACHPVGSTRQRIVVHLELTA